MSSKAPPDRLSDDRSKAESVSKRFRWLLIGAVLLALPVLGVLWLFNTNLGRFEETIERQLSQALEREVRFEKLSIELGWPTEIQAEAIRIAAPAWAGSEPFLTSGPVSTRFDPNSVFLAGPLVLDELRVQGLKLRLVRDEAGRNSAPSLGEKSSPAGEGDTRKPAGSPILLRDARIEDGWLQLVGPDAENIITVRTLTIDEGDDGMIAVSVDGTIDEKSMAFDGELGPFEGLLRGEAVRASGAGHFATLRAEGSISVDELGRPQRPLIDLTISGEGLGLLEQLFGAGARVSGPYELGINAAPVDDRWSFAVALNAQRLNADINGYASSLQDLSSAALDLSLSGPDLQSLLALGNIRGAPAEPFSLAGHLQRNGRQVELRDTELAIGATAMSVAASMSDFPNLRDSRLDLAISGPELSDFRNLFGLPGAATGPFQVTASILPRPGKTDILELELFNSLLRATASGVLSDEAAYRGSDFRISLETGNAQEALAWLPLPGISASPATLTGRFRYDGDAIALEESRLEGLYALDAEGSGEIGLGEAAGELRLALQLTGEEIGASLQALGVQWPLESAPFALAGTVEREAGQLRIDLESGKVGKLDLLGELTLSPDAGTGQFDLRADGQNLQQALPQLGAFTPAPVAFALVISGDFDAKEWRIEQSRLALGAASVTGNGVFDRSRAFASTGFTLNADVPSFREIGRWDDRALPDADLSVTLSASGLQDRLTFEQIELATAGTRLVGSGALLGGVDRPRLEIQLHSDELDLRGWGPADEETTKVNDSPATSKDERLFSAEPLPLDWMTGLDAALDMQLGLLRTPQRIISAIELSAQLDDGLLTLPRYRSKGALGTLDITGAARLLPEGALDLNLKLNASDLVLNRAAWENADPATLPVFNARGTMAARGRSVATLASSLDGELSLVASEGVLPGAGIGALNLYLLEQVFSVLMPGMTTREPTTLFCFAGRLSANDGFIRTEPLLALRTDKLTILSTGTLDLETEQLSMDFETTPTKLVGASLAELINPFVSLEGTLSNLKPVIDPGGTLVYGGIAAATGGLSIIAKGLWNRLRNTTMPCEQLRDAIMSEALAPAQ